MIKRIRKIGCSIVEKILDRDRIYQQQQEWLSKGASDYQDLQDRINSALDCLQVIYGQLEHHGDIDDPFLTQEGNWTLREVSRVIDILKGKANE